MIKKYLEFRWWKAISIIILNSILFMYYNFIKPACGYPPSMENPPICMSGEQYILIAIGLIITSYLVITIIYSIKKNKN